MPVRQRVETIIGILVGILGIVGLLVGTSLRHECTAVAETGQDTCSTVFAPGALAANSGTGSLAVLTILTLVVLGVVAGAVMHSVSGNSAWRALLWSLTILLLAGTILTLASIGLYLVPALVLALIVSALASGIRH